MRWNEAYHCEYYGKSMETETTAWSEFPNEGGIRRNKKIQKNSQSGIQAGTLTI